MSDTDGASNGKGVTELPECFVIMPISDPDSYASGHFRRVFEDLFVPACERAGYRAVRADQVRQTNLIHLDILQRILDSPMALCDLSGRNPNVFLELGLRQAFDRPVVLVQEFGAPQIFDIAPLRITPYRSELIYRDVLEDQDKLAAAMVATRDAVGNATNVNSIVRLLGLSHAASLPAAGDGDQTLTLLNVVMNELGNIKSELAALRRGSSNRERLYTSRLPLVERVVDDVLRVESRLGLIIFVRRYGLVKGMSLMYSVPEDMVRSAASESTSAEVFLWKVAKASEDPDGVLKDIKAVEKDKEAMKELETAIVQYQLFGESTDGKS